MNRTPDAPDEADEADEAPHCLSLYVFCQIAGAFERNRKAIGLSRKQLDDLISLTAKVIERELPTVTFADAA